MEIFFSAIIRSNRYEVNADDSVTICFASKIHDVGKMSISDTYLMQQTGGIEDPDAVKPHTILGAEAMAKIANIATGSGFFNFAYNMCRSHHEKWDGTGYPDRLAGPKIPFEARALSIVNMYDILRTRPINGKVFSHSEAVVRVNMMKGSFFEPSLVEIFMKITDDLQKVTLT